MDIESKNKIAELETKVKDLENWKNERIKQQITFPLDLISRKILNEYFLSIVGTYYTQGAGVREFKNYIIKQGLDGFITSQGTTTFTFIANSSNDTITIGRNILTNEQGSFNDDTQVILASDGTLPDPLLAPLTYYIINSSDNICQLSDTIGGSPINITNSGVGTHYIQAY